MRGLVNNICISGWLNNIYELRRVLRSFDKLVDERERIYQMDLRMRKQYLRQKWEVNGIEMEKQRRRDNLHNFTDAYPLNGQNC